MKLLALEAGGPVLGACLFDKGREQGAAFARAPQRQTEQLAPLVRGLLDQAGWKAAQLEAVACGLGPGSFSGLRSSLAFGTGLGLARPSLRLLGVGTLAAWAEAFAPKMAPEALVLLDGRRGQVYRAHLKRADGLWDAVEPEALVDLKDALAHRPGRAALLSDLSGEVLGAEPEPWDLDSSALASAIGRLALQALAAGLEPPVWEPLYLRRSEAEILWEKLHPKA